MDNAIEYNGISSIELGLKINRVNPFVAPTRRVTKYTVPGRNGAVIVDDGCYDNVQLDYTAALYHADIGDAAAAAAIKQWLCVDGNYHRLEDSRWPDHYMMGVALPPVITQIGSVRRSIEVAISFNCRPERWLKIGDVETPIRTVQAEQQPAYTYLNNGSGFIANPLLYIGTCTNDIIVQLRQSTWIGYAQYKIAAHSGVIEIDTRTRNAVFSESGQSANSVIAYLQNGPDEFELLPGVTQLAAYYTAVDDEFARVGIKPRWWVL